MLQSRDTLILTSGGAESMVIAPRRSSAMLRVWLPCRRLLRAMSSMSSEAVTDRIIAGEVPLRLLSSPDGDTIAVATPGTDVEVVARQGSWARVRLDGWVWIPATLPLDSAALGESPSAADLVANPERFTGRRVRWKVKYYSLERAEPVRTDFYEGEPFMLAAAPNPDDGMVYIAVPPELVSEVERLRPLQTVEVLARVRTGRSAVMGRPVLDLIGVIQS